MTGSEFNKLNLTKLERQLILNHLIMNNIKLSHIDHIDVDGTNIRYIINAPIHSVIISGQITIDEI